jgi:hypothetical protein
MNSEWRWKTPEFLSKERHFLQPIWDGNQSLKDKRILLWCEQGIGDTYKLVFLPIPYRSLRLSIVFWSVRKN